MWDGNLGDFLSAHPDYRFELIEYLESLQYTAARAAELARFQRSFSVQPGDYWQTEREAIRQAVARVAAYQQIDWDSSRY